MRRIAWRLRCMPTPWPAASGWWAWAWTPAWKVRGLHGVGRRRRGQHQGWRVLWQPAAPSPRQRPATPPHHTGLQPNAPDVPVTGWDAQRGEQYTFTYLADGSGSAAEGAGLLVRLCNAACALGGGGGGAGWRVPRTCLPAVACVAPAPRCICQATSCCARAAGQAALQPRATQHGRRADSACPHKPPPPQTTAAPTNHR